MINQFIRNFCLKGCKNIKKYRIVLGFEFWMLETSSIFYLLQKSPSNINNINYH